ncbi:MAG: HAMP domain-containing methyl-accepting chemotaxis protein [Anaerocolumna aminovalerica]|jgi:methyl-accepting chemotaxis protein|uniref:methyl-accepting chemotaxis protein n=1 Tax=Anaerocolumna aminovalerica TaxID=1527 RepID=UPI00290F1141|nr:HAMP domain-containing methyl-accepting chemotaxis protein [Anaerocolumna aminovalerica]MDU6266339.1 HAMP domain-containing methyl-accepting chemotaxis protein [Anaerocolumna aminovalerica]
MKKAIKQSTLTYVLNLSSVLLLIGIVIAFLFIFKMNSEISQANNDRFELTKNANRFMNGSAYLTNEVRAYAATGNQKHFDNYHNETNNLKNRDIGVANMKKIGITDAEQQKIDEMSALSSQLVPLEEKAMKDVQAGRIDNAIEYVYGDEYETAITKINEIKMEFLDMLDVRTQNQIDRLMGINRTLQMLTFVMILIVVVMQVLTLLVMHKKVLSPIKTIEQEMGEIAQGNLSSSFSLEPDTSEIGMLIHSIHNTRATLRQYIGDISEKLTQIAAGNICLKADTQYIGDFAPIQRALETIIHSLNDTLSQIDIAAEQVSIGADQVADGAQALAAGATEQAASIEELSVSIERIAEQATENSDFVNTAAEYLEQAGTSFSVGIEHMEQLTKAMEDIDSASSQIASITKTIEDIAFQTNILSLNAAIEAARAGSTGKSFAVVADEVRNLAAKSAEAAKQTGKLIQVSVDAVAKGTEITSQTVQILQEVEVKTAKVNESFDKIEQASAEQVSAIEQIKQGIFQVSAVVQNNAATAEENSATSEEMSAQASTLREEVGKFKLDKDDAYSMLKQKR